MADHDKVNDYKPVIMKNKPEEDAAGQYNYGKVHGLTRRTILGIEQGNAINVETSLYTTVESKENENLNNYPNGVLWNCNDSKIEVVNIQVGRWPKTDGGGRQGSDDGEYLNTRLAVYLFDDATNEGKGIKNISSSPPSTDGGNKIRTIIDTGNDFDSTPNMIGAVNWGKRDTDLDMTDFFKYGKCWTDGDKVEVKNFPYNSEYPGGAGRIVVSGDNPEWEPAERPPMFQSNPAGWTNSLTDPAINSSLWIVVRMGSDSMNEYWNLEGWHHTTDEKDRAYALLEIPKKQLYDIWKDQSGDSRTFTFGEPFETPYNESSDRHTYYLNSNYQDNYGDATGAGTSYKQPNYGIHYVEVKVTAPTWTRELANNPVEDFGYNTKWVSNLETSLLHFRPEYNMDFHNFPINNDLNFYGTDNYFNGNLIPDFRPISFISSSVGPQNLQNYYEQGTEPLSDTIAPATAQLIFRLADNLDNFNIPYNDSLIDGDIGYAFFVANWDWQDGDPKTLSEVAGSIPESEEELTAAITNEQLFDLKYIGTDNNTAEHTYNTPGLKIVKAIVFSYIQGVDLSYQALRWKLATIRISLSSSRAFRKDFVELGGIDFVTIPDPGIIQPIIGGLSSESVYVKSLKAVKHQNQFGEQEAQEKNEIVTALENSPGRVIDELGNHLGQANIAQVRFLNAPRDLSEMLNIDSLITNADGTEFYSHTDSSYWNGENNKFPLQSPVGKIFISEYTDLHNHCLIELNCGSLDGTTIRDSSGRGNKGILIGDFSIRKDEVNRPTVRDSFVDLPKTDSKDGAF